MARITVEDCLTQENNRFALVQLASKRTKQLLAGSRPLTDSKGNKAVVTSLREIAFGAVRFMTPEDEAKLREKEERLKELGIEPVAAEVGTGPDDLFVLPSLLNKDTAVAFDDDDEDDEEGIEDLGDDATDTKVKSELDD